MCFLALFPGVVEFGVEEDLGLLELQCTFIWDVVVRRFNCGKKR